MVMANGKAATTQSVGDTSPKLATDSFVATSFARLASPALAGTPSVPATPFRMTGGAAVTVQGNL